MKKDIYKNGKYEIEKDIVLKCWIVWEKITRNFKETKHFGKTKKECQKWLSTL